MNPGASENLRIDGKDRRIISILQKNSRTPYLEIAREIGVSGATIHERVRNLLDAGVITAFTAEVDQKKLGYGVTAVINAVLEHPSLDLNKLKEDLNAIPEIIEAHNLTGDTDLLLIIRTRDIEGLRRLLTERIQHLAGVKRLSTSIALDSPVMRR